MDQPFGGDEGEIRKRQRQRCFRKPVAGDMTHDPEQQTAGKKAKNAAADKQYGKLAEPCDCARLASGLDDSEEQNEQSNRGRVIEQRFASDEPRQAPRRADVTEDGDHRRRVGRGDNRAEQQTNDEGKLDKRP